MQLFLSSHQTVLCEKFLSILQENPPKNPFEQDIILTQSFAMNHYLTLKISDKLGIAMGTQMIYPKILVKMLYEHLVTKETTDVHPWEIKTLRWIILKVIKKLHPEKSESEQFQWSEELSQIFNNYLLYRDFMLEQWESNNHNAHHQDKIWLWQKKIWREIRKIFPSEQYLHHTQQTNKIIDLLQNNLDEEKKNTLSQICPRLFIFGISRTIPRYLDLWENLSQYTKVFVFALEYTERQKSQDTKENIQKTQAKWFIETLKQKSRVENLDWQNEKKGFLSTLQNIYLDVPLQLGPEHLKPDHSLMVRQCADKTREVEILRDILLMLFRAKDDEENENNTAKTPDILANDILVMAPNINDYTTLIRPIMQRAGIPFSIADEKIEKENTFFHELLLLLSLLKKDNPWSITQISEIIEGEHLSKKWDFYTERREIINWLNHARIKWGEKNHGNSWQKGIERLMRGYYLWLGKENINQDENIVLSQPPFFFEGSNAEELGNFLYFLDQLKFFKEKISAISSQSLNEWSNMIRSIIHIFFDQDNQNENEENARHYFSQIAKKLHNIVIQEPFAPKKQEKISWETFLIILRQELENPIKERGFLTRGVTFSSLSPMRAIPFRVIYLLGMGEEDFLHQQPKKSSIDYILAHPQPFDRSKKNEDRQLFFEAFFSAQEYFFLSYSENNQKDIQQSAPTNVFLELLHRIDDFAGEQGISNDLDWLQSITYVAAAHSYDVDNFTKITSKWSKKELLLRSPCAEDFRLAQNLQNLHLSKKNEESSIKKEIFLRPTKKKIMLEELIHFFSNPIKEQMKWLGVNPFMPTTSQNEDLEPLYPAKKTSKKTVYANYKNWELPKKYLEGNFFQASHKINWETIKQEGLLPFGYPGEKELLEINKKLECIFTNALKQIPSIKEGQKETLTHCINGPTITIEGCKKVWRNKQKEPFLIFCHYQKELDQKHPLKIKKVFEWLVTSLFFFSSPHFPQKEKKSYLFANETIWIFSAPEKNLLPIFIDGFCQGKMIPLSPQTAETLWQQEFDDKKKDEEEIKKKWINESKEKPFPHSYYKDLLLDEKSIDEEWEKTQKAFAQFLQPFAQYCTKITEKPHGKK